MEKRMMLMATAMMVLLVISANLEAVKSQGIGCYDACSTGCVSFLPDTRRMARCDRKCSIRCSPGLEADGHLK